MEHPVEQLQYWDSLSDSEKQAVRDSAVIRSYKAGSILHGNCDGGHSCLGMVHVISGEIRAYIVSDESREITLFRIRAWESCVLSASCLISQIHFDTQLTAVEDTELLIVPPAVFGRLTKENIYVRCFMYELAAERFSSAVRVMELMIFKRFDQRLATFFLNEYRKTGSAEILMTQEQIAQNVNSAREVVARKLKDFSADGMIEIRRGKIILKDIGRLEEINQ